MLTFKQQPPSFFITIRQKFFKAHRLLLKIISVLFDFIGGDNYQN